MGTARKVALAMPRSCTAGTGNDEELALARLVAGTGNDSDGGRLSVQWAQATTRELALATTRTGAQGNDEELALAATRTGRLSAVVCLRPHG